VLRKKFSAAHFWKEVREKQCTAVQYSGELGRYLLASQGSPFDKDHKVRIAFGNGLRPDIWSHFQTRFGIPQVLFFTFPFFFFSFFFVLEKE